MVIRIDINNVSYSYGNGTPALKNINFHIDDGEAIALIGVNGSGKSTLMKLLNGLIIADSGSYIFEGEEVNSKKMQNEEFAKSFHKK